MVFEEFWEKYTSEDITTISDTVIATFSQDLPKSVSTDYDLGEIVTEFTGHHETANKYEKIEGFGEAIKKYQPEVYANEGKYINKSLVTYYCFREEKQKLGEQVEDILGREYDYDLLLESFNTLLYYGHLEYVDDIIVKEYHNVQKSPKLIQGAEFDLAIVKYYIELEKLYEQYSENSEEAINTFREYLKQYGFNFDNEYVKHLKIGLSDTSQDKIQELLKKFPTNRTYIVSALEMKFLIMMQSKNCPFPVGGMIWHNLLPYFEERKTTNWKSYFSFKAAEFEKFIDSKSGFFSDSSDVKALLLWGSSYLLDFVYELNIIPAEQYNYQKGLLQKSKANFKKRYRERLWEFSFVHKWMPDNLTTAEDWEEEKTEFVDSYTLVLSENERSSRALEGMLNQSFEDTFNLGRQKPILNLTKIGRNEKVDVQYSDGTIKRAIKFKKVSKDIENGDCEIIRE